MKSIKSFDKFNEKKWISDAIEHPGALRNSLKKKQGEKISQGEINSEISKLKKKDMDKNKPGLQLGKKDKTKYKRLTLAKTLKHMHEHMDHSSMSTEEKAKAYEEISDRIASFYDEENLDNNDVDLCTIGEYICNYFGYI